MPCEWCLCFEVLLELGFHLAQTQASQLKVSWKASQIFIPINVPVPQKAQAVLLYVVYLE